jgi:hypothetical protein
MSRREYDGQEPPGEAAVAADPSRIPGAWERELTREVPSGVIAYREAPAGWLTKDGTVRTRPYREYVWAPAGGREKRLPSVSRILDATCPKPGVAHWSEARGAEGTLLAVKAGLVTAGSHAEDAIAIVREHGFGAEAAKNRSAKRGLNLHAINEHFQLTGEAPRRADHPFEHHGYIRSWVRMILALKPEPVEVEQLVVHGDDQYAGRLDMRAWIRGALETDDLKTQENGALYERVYWQTALYERAAVWCGARPADRLRAIVLPASGDWNEEQHTIIVELADWRIEAALAWYRAKRPIVSACQSRNRAVRS